ncbi:MAG TPA: phosphate acyltransferase PlsX [Aggregatilineales bacterium]|nr:phosphate acyltransferase PlsX [Chloroflexota bacterium]HOA22852.1 phosphate acyltransferase PlsX [Aggregatilineales bacterium]HQA69936.1 phosphate acyltransferase PlsX [Aggregatilineales bacterium]HQE18442.1 phosphate acyltransferase PlsX [Aggregatilineales bacterium]
MRIVVDAMGSDNRPGPDVAGAVLAAREMQATLILVGDEAQVRAELAKHDTAGLSLEVVHAGQVIEMTDSPTEAAKEKPNSSIHVGLGLVQRGEADAFVTMGNTGAVLTIATLFTLRRIRGVKRPALTAIFPHAAGRVVAADIGANADVKPEYLAQFAVMANAYARLVMGINQPRVALLSNGEEEGKGNELIKATIPLMRELKGVNYIGNVEPKEVLNGATDVVIHDGFTGNIFIKSIEAAASMVSKLLRQEITSGVVTSVGGLLAKPAFARVSKRVDPFEIGGAPLLGVNGVVIIGHGRSTDVGVKNAIHQARRAVEGRVIEAISEQLGV